MRTFKKNRIRRDIILRSKQTSNYFFFRTLFFGGTFFFLIGIPNFRKNLLFEATEIKFFPQGIVICFYGRLAFSLSLYRILRRVFSVGRGFNEYNKRKEKVYILRWNFPNKVRRVELSYVFSELLSLEIESQKQLLNPIELNLYLLLKDQRKIVLIRPVIENINSLKKIERFSASLAKFLQVPLKNLFVEVSFIKIFIEIVRLILKKVQFFIKK
jgi:hypothetical protein